MKSTFSILFYLKRSGVKSNGNMPIMGRITINGEQTQFSAKVEVNPEHWNVKAGKAIGRAKEVQEVNTILDSIKTTMTKIYRDLQEKESNITPERIKNIFFGLETKHVMLKEVFAIQLKNKKEIVGKDLTESTYKKYQNTLKKILSFLQTRHNLTDIPLKDINHQFLKEFEIYLLTTVNCNNNSAMKSLQQLKSIFIIARNNNWIQHDPFANFKLKFEKEQRGFLSQEELDRIKEYKFENKKLEQVRDIFIFSCYTGISFIDVKNLTTANIRTSFDGKPWIMINRQKTDNPSHIPLLEIPQLILDKYKGLPGGKLLPIPCNSLTNIHLKTIANLCGIEKRVSYHLARHTFATTVTLTNGVPIESVSKMLGHNNIKTTQVYAKITDKKVGQDMSILAHKITQEKLIQSSAIKSAMDLRLESLTLNEKQTLLNLPASFDETRIVGIWKFFSEEEKIEYWERNLQRLSGKETTKQSITVNQPENRIFPINTNETKLAVNQ